MPAELIKRTKVPVMKVGTHTASDGKTVTIADADLDGMISNLSGDLAAGYRPPVVLGHPKMDDPRYGDILSLTKDGGALFASFGVIPELDAQLAKGQYPDRSLRIARQPDGTYRIKHLGLLGVVPPAVQGLPAYQFAEGDSSTGSGQAEEITIDFSEGYRLSLVGRILRRVREYFIEKEGAEAADRIVGNWEIEELEREAREDKPETLAFNQSTEKEEEMGDVEKLKQELAEAQGKISDLAKSDQEQKDRIRVLVIQDRQRDFSAFCDGLKNEGRLSPAMVPAVMDFMEILSAVETFDFAEGDPSTASGQAGRKAAAPVEKFKELLGAYPKIIEFSETATKDKATGGQGQGTAGEKLDAFAREKMKADDKLTYSAAFSAVQSEHIDLAADYAAEVRG